MADSDDNDDDDDDDDDDDEVPVSLPELVHNADYREPLARVIDDSVSAMLSPEMLRVRDTDEATGYPVAELNLMRIAEHGLEVASRCNHHGHRQRCRKLPAGRGKCALAMRSPAIAATTLEQVELVPPPPEEWEKSTEPP